MIDEERQQEATKTPVLAHTFERDEDNFYTEPQWCSKRLIEEEEFDGEIVDPCAGSGNIPKSARELGYACRAFDLRDRGIEGVMPGMNFFKQWPAGYWPADNILSNPPYGRVPKQFRRAVGFDRIEDYFVHLAVRRSRHKVAVFLSSTWINASARGRWLETMGLATVYHCGPRPSCPPGRLVMRGMKAEGGKKDFNWYVFEKGHTGPYQGKWLRRDG